jgi:hypothetical protein
MDPSCRRFKREYGTLAAMTRLYCVAFHKGDARPCADCGEFLAYAHARIEHCPFGDDKPACADCPVHCYRPEEREHARTVMRYAGPKMPLRHPLMTVLHFWDKFRSPLRVARWRAARDARRQRKP